jgi:predicted HAD superfamily phosphohydrolase YqeG
MQETNVLDGIVGETRYSVTKKDILTENLSDMETILIQMESSSDIWQNRIIKGIARAVYNILLYLIREK